MIGPNENKRDGETRTLIGCRKVIDSSVRWDRRVPEGSEIGEKFIVGWEGYLCWSLTSYVY